jgi:hypothetical protein
MMPRFEVRGCDDAYLIVDRARRLNVVVGSKVYKSSETARLRCQRLNREWRAKVGATRAAGNLLRLIAEAR